MKDKKKYSRMEAYNLLSSINQDCLFAKIRIAEIEHKSKLLMDDLFKLKIKKKKTKK